MIDGNFKSMYHSLSDAIDGDNSKELQIILLNQQRIVVVFVSNRCQSGKVSLRFGESYILIGNDPTPFSSGLTECSKAFFDTGFYKITQKCIGRYVVVRRVG